MAGEESEEGGIGRFRPIPPSSTEESFIREPSLELEKSPKKARIKLLFPRISPAKTMAGEELKRVE